MLSHHLDLLKTLRIRGFQSRIGKLCRLWSIAVIFLCGSAASHAQNIDSANEYQLKAVFIYNFSKFIEWPESAFTDSAAGFQICVLGDDPFGEFMKALSNRNYLTHPILIKYPHNLNEAKKCHILYVSDSGKSGPWHDIVKNLGDAPVLTVSSSEEAMQAGIGIGFVIKDGKIRWAINLNSTRKAQLKVSAKLVEIAVSIIGETAR